jgi:hypothetical protein
MYIVKAKIWKLKMLICSSYVKFTFVTRLTTPRHKRPAFYRILDLDRYFRTTTAGSR